MKRDNGKINEPSDAERDDWARYIARGRHSRHWSQKELASKAGYSLETV